MQKYYEILDVKYWKPTNRHKEFFKEQENHHAQNILQIISLISLAFLFWEIAKSAGNYSWISELVGLTFALSALFVALRSGYFRKRNKMQN